MKIAWIYAGFLLTTTIVLISCTNNKVYTNEEHGLTFEHPRSWEPIFLHDNFLSIQHVKQGVVVAEIGVLFLDLPENMDVIEIMNEILQGSIIGKLSPRLSTLSDDNSSSADSITIVKEPHFFQHTNYNGASATVTFNGLANLQVSEDVSITVGMNGLADLSAIEHEDHLIVVYRFDPLLAEEVFDPLLDDYPQEQIDIIDSFKFSSVSNN
jgi:hypothetical protein